jgi:hypothetical protein
MGLRARWKLASALAVNKIAMMQTVGSSVFGSVAGDRNATTVVLARMKAHSWALEVSGNYEASHTVTRYLAPA